MLGLPCYMLLTTVHPAARAHPQRFRCAGVAVWMCQCGGMQHVLAAAPRDSSQRYGGPSAAGVQLHRTLTCSPKLGYSMAGLRWQRHPTHTAKPLPASNRNSHKPCPHCPGAAQTSEVISKVTTMPKLEGLKMWRLPKRKTNLLAMLNAAAAANHATLCA